MHGGLTRGAETDAEVAEAIAELKVDALTLLALEENGW